jgi:enoyl-CoA hydratase/carnithine racemase
MTGDLLDAGTALRIGLVHEVVPGGTGGLEARTAAVAATLASRAQVSLAGAKALIALAAAGEMTEGPQVQEHYHASLHGPEYAEGVAAFLAKRDPDFRAARRRG